MSNLTEVVTEAVTEAATNVTESSPVADPSMVAMYETTKFTIHSIVTPLVVTVGVVGNIISMIVLTRRRMRSSTNSYLTALAVPDSLYLLLTLTLSLKHSVPGISHPDHRLYWHYWRYAIWLVDAASNTSTWLTVTFTVERYVAVCHPIRGQVYCTISRARKMICAVYLVCFLVTIPTPFEWIVEERLNKETNTTEMGINFSDLGNQKAYRDGYYWFTACTFVFIPLVLLAFFNSFLILAVKKSRKQRAVLCAGESQSVQQENKITIMLIAVVIIYMICQLPHACMLLHIANVGEGDPHSNTFYITRIINNVFNVLVAINAACNFVLYCALSDKYRKTFLVTFCRCWYQPQGVVPSCLPTASSNISEFSRTGSPRSIGSLRSSFRSSLRSQRSLRENGTRPGSQRNSPNEPPHALLGVPGKGKSESETQGLLDVTGRPVSGDKRRQARPPRRFPRWLRPGRNRKSGSANIVVTTPDGSQEEGVTAV